MIHYILQTIAFQLVFLLAYDVFLKKETFFNWNRLYLLATAIFSLVLPFIKVNSFKAVIPQNYIISLPEVVLGASNINANNAIILDAVVLENNPVSYWEILFYTGVFTALSLFLFKLTKIFVLALKNPRKSIGNIVLVELINSNAAFSFFHYIFLGEKIKAEEKKAILKHELIHTKQKHTLDLLFFEILRIVFWFNPLVYMYQNRMATLHEFIADANAVKHQDKNEYYQNLLAQVFETKNISFINTFFKQSLIKKRIVMLSKTKSKQINLLKYALLIPMVFGMLVYTSAEAQEIKKENKDLSKYSFSHKIGDYESEPVKKNYKMRNTFLKKNPNYVIWALHDVKEKKVSSSLHNINEPIPDDYEFQKVIIKDGPMFVWYIKFINEGYYENKTVPYSLPKAFKVTDKIEEKESDLIPLDEVEVPFAVIENVPVYPGCEDVVSNIEKKKCMSEKITNFVAKNFNTKKASEYGLSGRQRINVIFKIDTKGNIVGVRSRAPHPALEAEAIRVISSLPKMKPGIQRGKAVTVPYSLPIIFEVEDTQMLDETFVVSYADGTLGGIILPFATVAKAPVLPECKSLETENKKRACTSDGISKYVNKNFNTDLASQLGLKGRQRINVVFKITKKGKIEIEKSRAPHPDLEAEAIRVIKSIPKLIPGEHEGKKVDVLYSLPIIFQVQE